MTWPWTTLQFRHYRVQRWDKSWGWGGHGGSVVLKEGKFGRLLEIYYVLGMIGMLRNVDVTISPI